MCCAENFVQKTKSCILVTQSIGNCTLEIASLFHPKKFPMKQLPILEFTMLFAFVPFCG